MKQIVCVNKMARSLCGAQSYDETRQYRSASFSLALPTEEGVVLFHTLTGELLLLSEEEYDRRQSDAALRKALTEKYFLVPENFNEKQFTDQIRTIAGMMQKKSECIKCFKIFTTTDCNARCFYCYEMGRSRIPMSDEVARDAAAYISRVSKGQKVKLNWFGGEPLFHQRAIEIIVSELNKAGTAYGSAMISNGYLFDRETVRKARDEWKLEHVQITLDGTEAVYNRTKAYQNAEESAYKKVLGNIESLLDAGIRIRVRMNMHKKNAEDLGKLIEELAARFPGREGFSAYLALLRDFEGELFGLEQMEALQTYRTLDAALLRYGLRKPKKLNKGMRLNYCMADDDACITITPDGRLGKCEHYSESEFVGSLYTEGLDQAVIASWKEKIDRIEECASCAYYPLCNHLKKCSYTSNTCTELDRHMRLDELKERVYTSYAGETGKSAIPDDADGDWDEGRS